MAWSSPLSASALMSPVTLTHTVSCMALLRKPSVDIREAGRGKIRIQGFHESAFMYSTTVLVACPCILSGGLHLPLWSLSPQPVSIF